MQILIAEDDCVSRRVLEAMLLKWGYEVVLACDGKEAWEAMQRPDAPPMAILDWMMPGMDGVEVCERLRQLKTPFRPYVILLTGKGQKKDLVKGINAGADDYVIKPFEPDELRVRIYAGERILDLQVESLAIMEALRKQATHDYLTGLRNRVSMLDMLQKEFEKAPRSGKPVSVVMADIDYFKSVNDRFGHQAGDTVLTEVARRMAMEIRSYEDIGRYGGEEFIAVLSECDTEGAQKMGERLCQAVAAKPFEINGEKIHVTISIGVAASTQWTMPSEDILIRMADIALYRAKQAGRNRVELWSSSFPDPTPAKATTEAVAG